MRGDGGRLDTGMEQRVLEMQDDWRVLAQSLWDGPLLMGTLGAT